MICFLRPAFLLVAASLCVTPAGAAPADAQGKITVAISYFDNNTGKADLCQSTEPSHCLAER